MSTDQALFTCLSCSIALVSAEEQSASGIVFYTIFIDLETTQECIIARIITDII